MILDTKQFLKKKKKKDNYLRGEKNLLYLILNALLCKKEIALPIADIRKSYKI